jgi:hypothetical protein
VSELSELTPRIGKVARRSLALNGFRDYDDLTRATSRQLLDIHGVGQKAVRILREELGTLGLALADEP